MTDTASAVEEIRIIRRMIETSRRNTTSLRIPLLVYGGLGVVASLVSHALLSQGREQAIGFVWMAFLVLGLTASAFLLRRREKRGRIVSFVDRALAVLWIGVGISIVLVAITHAAREPSPAFVAVIAYFIALALCASGKLMEWPPLYAAAGVWWAGGVVMWFRPHDVFLIEAVLMVVGYLLPAYLLGGRDDRSAQVPSENVE